jgi:hypothetical protein
MTRKRNNNSSNQRNPSNYDAYKGTDRVTRSQTSSPSQANDNSSSTGNNKGKHPPAKRVHLDNSQQSTSKGSNSASLTSQQLDEQEVARTYGQANATVPPPQDASQRVPQPPSEEARDQEVEMEESDQGTNENPPIDHTPIVPPTRLYAAVPFEEIKGKSLKAKIETMNKIFMSIFTYRGCSLRELKKVKYLTAQFTNQTDLDQACTLEIPAPTAEIPDKKIKLQIWSQIKPPVPADTVTLLNARTIQVIDIPLDVTGKMVTAAFKRYGIIEKLTMRTKHLFQQAYIRYADAASIQPFMKDHWCAFIQKHCVRVLPITLSQDDRTLRQQFCHKLAGIPRNCLPGDLFEFLKSINAKTCFIPQNIQNYRQHNFAFINFLNQEDYDRATLTSYSFQGNDLFWYGQSEKTCFTCGSPKHSVKVCPKRNQSHDPKKAQLSKLYQRYCPAQHKRPSAPPGGKKPFYADMAKQKPTPKQNKDT